MKAEKRAWKISVRVGGSDEWIELGNIASEGTPEFRIRVPDGVPPPKIMPFSMVWTEDPREDDTVATFIAQGGVRDA